MIHLYIGNGKGKTSAAFGLAMRAAGHKMNVLVAQFLKSGGTGEINSLEKLGIPVIRSQKQMKFVFNMNDKEKEQCRDEQIIILSKIKEIINKTGQTVLILDEVIDALNTGMINEKELREFTELENSELVLTGRNPPQWLVECAAYITEMRKIKHPFDSGIAARPGIEF
ncbi:MAG: cob(I)yrinic acid a,c-diamide adenosyltransferase [Spirochaetaceae bacterium]|jgi:cob(I)alamin adenosyltransferase|nr:cob(I)yrinic acid a,c-diamide adenosyltransferase [Spirochaetaceae bacterium]